MRDNEFPIDYSARVATINCVRLAFEKFKHHKNWSNRITPILQSELPHHIINLKIGSSKKEPHELVIWGKSISFDNRIWIVFWSEPWQKSFIEELDRTDPSDYAERQEQEIKLLPELNEIQSQIKMLRARAEILIVALPIPASAPLIRSTAEQWSEPSSALRRKYPTIWPDKKIKEG